MLGEDSVLYKRRWNLNQSRLLANQCALRQGGWPKIDRHELLLARGHELYFVAQQEGLLSNLVNWGVKRHFTNLSVITCLVCTSQTLRPKSRLHIHATEKQRCMLISSLCHRNQANVSWSFRHNFAECGLCTRVCWAGSASAEMRLWG